ncbi:ATP-binding cassette domain-containing protein [Luteibacter yeojuensis]|uniref:ABC transporter ATP-binding protein n=1 Tax=Luteibacter yeojuensis TaxID=345309 RepID=A0A0F3L072_9GAMM|nr:ABC transporter ATP-binding protein [Luteibacter yeojuensis]KJV36801.1 ABC transporter ATP-binding protein [Luteibacter yeojuensis]
MRIAPAWRGVLALLPRAERVSLLVYALLSVGAAVSGSVSAVLLVPLVQPGHDVPLASASLATNAAGFALAGVAFAWLRWQSARLGAAQVARFAVALRGDVHAHLLRAPLRELDGSRSAEIANVLTYNGEILVQGFSAMQQLAVALLTSLVSIGFAFWISPLLMLSIPVLLAAIVLTSRVTGKEQADVSRRYVADMTALFWHSEDFPRRLRHVRSFGREDAERASYGDVSQRLGEGYRRQLELVASSRLVLELGAALGIPAVFVLAHRGGSVDGAGLVAVGLLLGRLLPYLVSTRQGFQQLRSAEPALVLWQRYMHVAAAPSQDEPPPGGGEVAPITIDHLRVQPPRDGLILEGLVLRPGELILVTGDSGIGKSSLVDALAGMAPPATFAARRGATPLDFAAWQAHVARGAYVAQGVRPWQRTVREVLQWADPEATDATLRATLRTVGLLARVDAATEGLGLDVNGPASRLSGGEMQRLMLAQVILRRPVLAVLDEATSGLDGPSELAVLRGVRASLPGTILLVVSHREAVATIADVHVRVAAGYAEVDALPTIRTIVPSRRPA